MQSIDLYSSSEHDWGDPVFKFKNNGIEFSFSSNNYSSIGKTKYSFILQGFDDQWSEYSVKNSKEYTNLKEGTYSFLVKSIDLYENISESSTFNFEISPPLHRSAVAKILYVLFVVLLVFVLNKFRKMQIKKVQEKLRKEKEIELGRNEAIYRENQLNTQKRIVELENDKLQQNLVHKNKELANSAMNILHKNEILLELKKEMQNLYLEKNLSTRDRKIKRLIHMVDGEMDKKKVWDLFTTTFNKVHEDFLNRVKNKFPSLNQNDLRLCAFIKMNKSTKEIAILMNLSVRGVESSRYRLRKKMELGKYENLNDVIFDI